MSSRLSQLAAQAAKRAASSAERQAMRHARRAFGRTGLGQLLSQVQQMAKSTERGTRELQRLRSQIRKAKQQARKQRYAMDAETEKELRDLLRSLGPLGEIVDTVMNAQREDASLEQQLEAASRFLESFGYDVELPRAKGDEIETPAPDPTPGAQPSDEPLAPPSGRPEEPGVKFSPEVFTPGSSNVYSFRFRYDSRRTGTLFVTFKTWYPGIESRPNSPGSTYAYSDVPTAKFQAFKRAAKGSAGGAVWDYLRVRGSAYAHQHSYRLDTPTMTEEDAFGGVYVPRRASRRGLRTRAWAGSGRQTGRRGFIRSQLPERIINRGAPRRARPDRAAPNRGT